MLRAAPISADRPIRAVWVARFHYQYPEDIRTILANCKALGFNTVLWQVRGEATVAYPSRIEPWSREYGFADPGFDPLRIAVDEAHKLGLRIEAWVNVMPGWKGRTPPSHPGHIYNAHPDWFLHDANGRRQALADDYVIVNPCLPDVREHIVRVFEEIARNYDIDGLHLDYVRWAWDTTPGAMKLYPRDPRTLAIYRRETGLAPDDDPERWKHWRANQVTRIVGDTRAMLNRVRRGASLTAAVWGSPTRGYHDFLQNAVAWLRSGLIDAAMPMAYTDKLESFRAEIDEYRALAPSRRIIPGIGLYKINHPDALRAQVRWSLEASNELAAYSYESLHATASDRASRGAGAAVLDARAMRRDVMREALRR